MQISPIAHIRLYFGEVLFRMAYLRVMNPNKYNGIHLNTPSLVKESKDSYCEVMMNSRTDNRAINIIYNVEYLDMLQK